MGTSIVLFAVAFFWIPEIKGLTTEEIDKLYEGGVSPRRFGKVNGSEKAADVRV